MIIHQGSLHPTHGPDVEDEHTGLPRGNTSKKRFTVVFWAILGVVLLLAALACIFAIIFASGLKTRDAQSEKPVVPSLIGETKIPVPSSSEPSGFLEVGFMPSAAVSTPPPTPPGGGGPVITPVFGGGRSVVPLAPAKKKPSPSSPRTQPSTHGGRGFPASVDTSHPIRTPTPTKIEPQLAPTTGTAAPKTLDATGSGVAYDHTLTRESGSSPSGDVGVPSGTDPPGGKGLTNATIVAHKDVGTGGSVGGGTGGRDGGDDTSDDPVLSTVAPGAYDVVLASEDIGAGASRDCTPQCAETGTPEPLMSISTDVYLSRLTFSSTDILFF